MTGTILFIAIMWFLIKFGDTDSRWWLAYFILLCLIAKSGCELNIFQLALTICVWKFVKDVFVIGGRH